MGYVRVDPAVLVTVSARLLDSVEVAARVKDSRDELKAAVDAEHDVVRGAVHSFLDQWAYGCECLIDDATQTAARLERASECYLEHEDALAAAYRVEPG